LHHVFVSKERFGELMSQTTMGVSQDFEQEICPLLCSTFRGKVMGQNGV
jgi:hypothetical protein